MPQIDRKEGRRLFGSDPAGYDAARPGHPDRVYEVLVDRCGLGQEAAVLEIGPGTGQATRRLLELGADPLVAVEPDPALVDYLISVTDRRPDIRMAPLEEVELPAAAFDLAVAASSFHWVDEAAGLAKIAQALRPGGWWAMWWTLFGDDARPDPFRAATDPIVRELPSSPHEGGSGRPRFALDVETRTSALAAAGFKQYEHELIPWSFEWDTAGIRALFATFSPIARLEQRRREAVLDAVAKVAEDKFDGLVIKPLLTSIYTAQLPPG
ncbi:MAG: methyltransferase-like protein [Thermoleophilia bacterium]|nr:methyltransferase-like protein [Thermoleophilia bacterium]